MTRHGYIWSDTQFCTQRFCICKQHSLGLESNNSRKTTMYHLVCTYAWVQTMWWRPAQLQQSNTTLLLLNVLTCNWLWRFRVPTIYNKSFYNKWCHIPQLKNVNKRPRRVGLWRRTVPFVSLTIDSRLRLWDQPPHTLSAFLSCSTRSWSYVRLQHG